MSRKSAQSYQQRTLAFVAWCEEHGVTRADQIDYPVMSAFVRARSATVKARTVNRDVVPIRTMFAWAKREQLVKTNPFRHEDFRELKLKEPQPNSVALTLSTELLKTVVSAAPAVVGATYAALVALLAGSGLRIDEARHIDERDVRTCEDGGFITVAAKDDWQPKNYRRRTIPVSRATCEAALQFIRTRNSVRLDGKATWDVAKRLHEHLEIMKFSMHDLRRAWASALHANGMPLKRVSALLGHCGVGVTERYLRLTDEGSSGHEFLPM
jgi:site-specific recombinase XerD